MLCNFNIPEMQLTEEAGALAGSGVHAVDTMNSDQLAANANEKKQVFAYRWKVLDFVKSVNARVFLNASEWTYVGIFKKKKKRHAMRST